MAFCSNCGSEIPDGAKFCGVCGQPVLPPEQAVPGGAAAEEAAGAQGTYPSAADTPGAPSAREHTPAETPSGAYAQGGMPPAKKGLSLKMLIIIAAVAAAAVIALVVLLLGRKSTIDLNKYVSVEFTGYSGFGEAEVNFDDYTFMSDFQAVAKGRKNSSILSDLFDTFSSSSVYDAFDWEITPEDHLSNGDTVTLHWVITDETIQKENKVRLTGSDQTFTVEGLEEVREVDPFEDVEVVFDGAAPYVSVDVVNNSDDEVISGIWFMTDIPELITPESTVRVYIDEDDVSYYEEYYGLSFTQTSKEYSCESVDRFAETLADFNDSVRAELQTYTVELLDQEMADLSGSYSAGEWTYEGMILASPTEDPYADTVLSVVYSADVTDLYAKQRAEEHQAAVDEYNKAMEEYKAAVEAGEEAEEPTPVPEEDLDTVTTRLYFPMTFYNPIVHADGTMEFESDYYYINDYDAENGDDNFAIGYQNKDQLIQHLITEMQDEYAVDYSVEM